MANNQLWKYGWNLFFTMCLKIFIFLPKIYFEILPILTFLQKKKITKFIPSFYFAFARLWSTSSFSLFFFFSSTSREIEKRGEISSWPSHCHATTFRLFPTYIYHWWAPFWYVATWLCLEEGGSHGFLPLRYEIQNSPSPFHESKICLCYWNS